MGKPFATTSCINGGSSLAGHKTIDLIQKFNLYLTTRDKRFS